MSIKQYQAYCETFQLKPMIQKLMGRMVKGVGGTQKAIWEARIHIPFKDIGIIIGGDFLLLPDTAQSFLSLKNMVENVLDISIKNQKVTLNGRNRNFNSSTFF